MRAVGLVRRGPETARWQKDCLAERLEIEHPREYDGALRVVFSEP
jgi:hypothetical protein